MIAAALVGITVLVVGEIMADILRARRVARARHPYMRALDALAKRKGRA